MQPTDGDLGGPLLTPYSATYSAVRLCIGSRNRTLCLFYMLSTYVLASPTPYGLTLCMPCAHAVQYFVAVHTLHCQQLCSMLRLQTK